MIFFRPSSGPASSFPLPEGHAIHPGFTATPIGCGPNALRLTPPRGTALPAAANGFRLAIAIGYDIRGNQPTPIRATTGMGRPLGIFDIRFACPFEPFILDLTGDEAAAALANGLVLSSEPHAEGVVRIFTSAPGSPGAERFLPSLYPTPSRDRYLEFQDRLFSLASLHPFSWLEGCVMEGLSTYAQREDAVAKRARAALTQHWDYFSSDGVTLRYCDPRSTLRVNEVYGHECALPFVTLASLPLDPNDVRLHALEAYAVMRNTREITQPGADDYTTEACYTLAYPAIALGYRLGRERLIEAGIGLIERRIPKLWRPGRLTQSLRTDGSRAFVNWARGVAWFLLGISRAAAHFPDSACPEEFRRAFEEVSEWIVRQPRVNGLWSCFVDAPETGPEISGSCGIAAALVSAVQLGWLGHLPESDLACVCEVRNAAASYLTPEGWLGGVSQINRDGERLQRNGYRVLSQMGMGLFGLLDGLLRDVPAPLYRGGNFAMMKETA